MPPQGAILVVAVSLLAWHTGSTQFTSPSELQTLKLEDMVPLRPEFHPERVSVQWVSGTEYIYTELGVGVVKYDAVTDTLQKYLDEKDLIKLGGHSVTGFSKDANYFLVSSHRRKVYRYSSIADYAVYDLENKTVTPIVHKPLQAVVWANHNALAYVFENNVYYIPDAARPETVFTLTTQGEPDEVYFGVTDWIYEEEVFNSAEALWFSTNGTYLAVASFNDTDVESAEYPYYGIPSNIADQYPETVRFKYPKAGRTNPVVGLQVFNLSNLGNEPRIIPAPVEIIGADHILGRVTWASDRNLIILWLNRRQNVSVLVNCNLEKAKCDLVKQTAEPNGWIDIREPFIDTDGKKLVEIQPLYHQDKRFLHVARFDFNTLETEDLSPGTDTVTEIVAWKQDTDAVYYIISPSTLPWSRQLWVTSAGEQRCISCMESSCVNAGASFAPGGAYGLMTCSGPNIPPTTYLYNAENNSFKLIKDNSKLKIKLSQFKLPMPLFNVMSFGNNLTGHVKLLLPPDMKADAKLPMVVKVYSGPGTSRVRDNFELDYATYLTGNRSFIMANIDVRGSGVMGVEALHSINNALGTYEVTDTLAVIRRLTKMYPFIDAERVGVWGWSYGGFATTMMLMKDDQRTLACGAAVAPVTSWLYYDSIYTERYMDTPQANPVGYHHSDLMLSAQKLRGRRFLLIHGTGDDNVHYQNSLQLAKKLQHEDIEFEQMSYTDETHSLFGVSRHFYHTLDRFWTECFA